MAAWLTKMDLCDSYRDLSGFGKSERVCIFLASIGKLW